MSLVPTNQLMVEQQKPKEKQGLFQRLLSDPNRMQMALMGLGMLGTKSRQMHQNYLGGANDAMTRMSRSPLLKAQADNLAAQTGYYGAQAADLANPEGVNPFEKGGINEVYRIINTYGSKLQRGEQLSPDEAMAYRLAIARLTQQRTQSMPDGSVQNIPPPDVSFLPMLDGMNLPAVPNQVDMGPKGGDSTEIPHPLYNPASQELKSPGDLKIDSAFATDWAAWTTGGYADVQKNMGQLAEALYSLESGEVETGDLASMFTPYELAPKLAAMARPEFMNTKEMVEEVVQRNLRAILGPQFTAKEGERLISRAYNPALSTEQNARRVRRILTQMAAAAEAKQQAGEYWNANNGTLKGYEGKVFTKADFDPEKLFEAAEAEAGDRRGDDDAYYMDSDGRWTDREGNYVDPTTGEPIE